MFGAENHDPPSLELSDEDIDAHLRSILALDSVDPSWCASQPILRFRPEDLPDVWTADLHGVWVLLRRLLSYAGLEDRSIHLEDGRTGASDFADPLTGQLSYMGHTPGRDSAGLPVMSFWVGHIGAPEAMIGPACLAVGWAWLHEMRRRAQPEGYRHQGDDQRVEFPDEAEAALAAVALGFGLILANAAYDPRSVGQMRGVLEQIAWVNQSLGLPVDTTTYALALWLTLTDTPEAEAVEYRRALNPSQQLLFDDALAQLQGQRGACCEAVGMPIELPPRRSLVRVDIDDDALREELAEHEERVAEARRYFNRGVAIARAQVHPTMTFAGLGAVVGAGVCLAMAAPLPGLLLPLIGAGAARFVRRYRCADPDCESPQNLDDTTCPRCGGDIVVDVKHPRERLAAIEAWAESRGIRLDD